MAAIKSQAIEHEIKRFMRADWRRYWKPGHEDDLLYRVYESIERKYRPDQPRLPAGRSDGGQWTNDDGAGGDSASHPSTTEPTAGSGRSDSRVLSDATRETYLKPGARLAANDAERRYTVNLGEEEQRGGHTLRDHVGKTDEELLQVMNAERGDVGFYGYVRQRQGTFESAESANDLVNRTLERNTAAVDEVASGNQDKGFLTSRFGHITGREAYRPNPDADPVLRNTYGVGVGIVHDARTSRGYRVYTAYPRND